MRQSGLLSKVYSKKKESGPDVVMKKKPELVSIIGQWLNNYATKSGRTDSEINNMLNNANIKARNFNIKNVPEDAKKAIETAVYITGTDKKSTTGNVQNPEKLKNHLYHIGLFESNYETKKQYEGGPARSYWQIEPNTARDTLNQNKLFGNKFNEIFSVKYGENPRERLSMMDDSSLSNVLEKDDELAATLASMYINRTYTD
jgi:hypothetical protein